MIHLINLLSVAILLVNLLGFSLAVARYTGLTPGLAKAVSVVGGCLVFFFIEHFIGLGKLGWLLPILTGGSLWIIWQELPVLKKDPGAEIVFLVGFGYALLWRYVFPNIDASSEKMTGLNFVASYMRGGHLPVPDLWLAGYPLDSYYAFQHYAAALLGRILSVSCGTAYNLAYCVITGLVLAPAYDFIRVFTKNKWSQVLILGALLVGGTGASIITPFAMKNEQPFSSMRFIGASIAANAEELTPWGLALQKFLYGSIPMNDAQREHILDLPMETFSYAVQLGDYHPPLGSFVLLATALAAFGMLLGKPKKGGGLDLPASVPRRWATGALTGTVPLCIVTNAWCFPLQALLVAGCLLFLWCYRERPRWEELIGIGLLPWVLLYPALAYFLSRIGGVSMKAEWVQAGQHAPLFSYLLLMWPVLGLMLLAWFAPAKKQREFRWFAIAVAFFLLLTEMVNIDDIYAGHFQRFNTVLKWWPWVAALSLLLLAPLNLASFAKSRAARVGTILILLGTLSFTIRLGRAWILCPKTAIGQLDGAAWLRNLEQDSGAPQNLTANASIFNYLAARPQGVTLEPPVPEHSAFVETSAMSLFTGHPTVLGWYPHEQLWRGYQRDIEQRWNRANEFFRGDSPAPLDFLASYNVRFILWPGTRIVTPELFNKIKSQIESRYLFVRFDEGQPMKGIWERK